MKDTESQVCADILERQQKGIKKYGQSVAENPLSQREWIQHAYEEALDLAVYLRRLLQSIDNFHHQIEEAHTEYREGRALDSLD